MAHLRTRNLHTPACLRLLPNFLIEEGGHLHTRAKDGHHVRPLIGGAHYAAANGARRNDDKTQPTGAGE